MYTYRSEYNFYSLFQISVPIWNRWPFPGGTRDSSESHGDDDVCLPPKHGWSSVTSSSVHVTGDSSESNNYNYDQHPSLRGRSATSLRGSRDSSESNHYNYDQHTSLRGRSATSSLPGSRNSSKSDNYNFVQPPSIRRRAATSTIPGSHDSSGSYDYIDIQLPRLRSRASYVRGPCEPQSQSSVDDSDSDDDYVPPARGLKHELVSSSGSIRVALSSNTEYKRKWDKKQYCVYSSKCFSKLPRHFEQKHANEIEVAEAISLPLKSIKRKLIWEKLCREGNYDHNTLVLNTKRGEIVPLRRPSESCSADRFIPCEFCKAFLVKGDSGKHQKNCNMRNKNLQANNEPSKSANKNLQASDEPSKSANKNLEANNEPSKSANKNFEANDELSRSANKNLKAVVVHPMKRNCENIESTDVIPSKRKGNILELRPKDKILKMSDVVSSSKRKRHHRKVPPNADKDGEYDPSQENITPDDEEPGI